MKIIAYCALHYGTDYLGSAIKSVIDSVQEFWILYTAIGSHGSRTDTPCPDTKDELYQIAKDAAGSKLRWRQSEWPYEGAQRDSIHQYVPDADVILTVDADEVWSINLAHNLIEDYEAMARLNGHPWGISRLRIPMVHYWRSFYRCVLHDPAFPERMIFPKVVGGSTNTATIPFGHGIHHFGYAQRPEIVEYKILTHGHRSEWRHDVDWFQDRFMANAQTDCHPVGSEFWQPEEVDPFALGLPEWMLAHPYANMQVIE